MTAQAEIRAALNGINEVEKRASGFSPNELLTNRQNAHRAFLNVANQSNIAELLAVVDALKKDKERLDWLDRELACPLSLHDGRYINLSESGLRDVIDAAMKRTTA